jgi:hypothetical protein
MADGKQAVSCGIFYDIIQHQPIFGSGVIRKYTRGSGGIVSETDEPAAIERRVGY